MGLKVFEFFVILAILANSSLLCMHGVVDEKTLEDFNLIFT